MTIGRYSGGDLVGEAPSMKERCKPDYEMMINRTTQKREAAEKALKGLLMAHEADVHIPGDLTLVQAVGFLVLQKEELSKAITKLIAEQESQSD